MVEIDFIHAVVAVLSVIGIGELYKKIRKKTVWIVEDSENDLMLLKMKLVESEHCHFIFFRNLKDIPILRTVFSKPDGVIVDYLLRGSHRGDELFKWCERNQIPCVLCTGYEAEIFGVDKVIKKETGGEHITQINDWLKNKQLI